MSRKTKRQNSDRIIHIRIDEETHRMLKMEAASSETTIQQIVESLLRKKFPSKTRSEEDQ
jgi:predicted HicB family RNase H-like nuclease